MQKVLHADTFYSRRATGNRPAFSNSLTLIRTLDAAHLCRTQVCVRHIVPPFDSPPRAKQFARLARLVQKCVPIAHVLISSGYRESNPGHTHPMGAHYHYAIARLFDIITSILKSPKIVRYPTFLLLIGLKLQTARTPPTERILLSW